MVMHPYNLNPRCRPTVPGKIPVTENKQSYQHMQSVHRTEEEKSKSSEMQRLLALHISVYFLKYHALEYTIRRDSITEMLPPSRTDV